MYSPFCPIYLSYTRCRRTKSCKQVTLHCLCGPGETGLSPKKGHLVGDTKAGNGWVADATGPFHVQGYEKHGGYRAESSLEKD